MDNAQLLQLIELLPRGNFKASKMLAEELNLSSRTVRNRLNEIDTILKTNGARIEAKPRYGVRLIIENQLKFQNFLKRTEDRQERLPNSQEERIQYLLDYLLIERDHYVTIEELAEQLYVSRSTLTNDLKVVKQKLEEYNIELETKPKNGVRVKGKEFDLRLCIANNSSQVLLNELGYVDKESGHKQIERISKLLNKAFEEAQFNVSGIAYQNLVSHLFIAVNRMRDKSTEEILESDRLLDIKENYSSEYTVAKKIAHKLQNAFEVKVPEKEIGYITIHLAGKKMLELQNDEQTNLVISDENNQIIKSMLDLIYEYFNIDFRDDLELRMSLALHLIPLKVRMSYDMSLKNPLLKEIKTRFTLAYTIAVQACSILETKFKKEISESEIGYFALHFNLALERKHTKEDLKNILIVCSSGRGTAELLSYRFENEFGEHINQIKTIDLQQLKHVSFETFDYIITTVPIPFSVPIPILEINYFLEGEDIQAVKSFLSSYPINDLEKYYTPQLFLTGVKAENKDEVIRAMVEAIHKEKDVPEVFYDEVMKREEQASTEFGNLVAIPHPAKALSEETFVTVAILDKPIMWNEKKVQFVYMMSIENNVNKDLQAFYKVTSRFLINKEQVKNVIKKKKFKYLMETIQKVKKEIGEV